MRQEAEGVQARDVASAALRRHLHAVEGLINGVTEVGRFTLFGATFQNWMLVAIAIVLVGVLIAWWRQQ